MKSISITSIHVGFIDTFRILKALLKMEIASYPKSPPEYKSCFRDGKHSLSINSMPISSKVLIKMESAPYPLSPLDHFLYLEIFVPLDLEQLEIFVFNKNQISTFFFKSSYHQYFVRHGKKMSSILNHDS